MSRTMTKLVHEWMNKAIHEWMKIWMNIRINE